MVLKNMMDVLLRMQRGINGNCEIYYRAVDDHGKVEFTVYWSDGWRAKHQAALQALSDEETLIDYLITVFNRHYREAVEEKRRKDNENVKRYFPTDPGEV